ncbi:MBL fold metallo-hydrolase [Lentzea sp. HUAS12]|uniref:MBL fold metallo-hydrolase n=1 Tax=Lentzea sp. HUAS12 TaxID=2951806 RepID=UPI00209CA450|nr:MBL fold metallo-hydrolase [Lentzea sp. HUAS12]USX53936.1 MBL fold metallo-hydrolase [Lentzea sp. HUAS12]
MPAERVAEDVYVIRLGRGLMATNVYLVRTDESWVLIDTGWRRDADAVSDAAEALLGAGARPIAILLTHLHPDHSGAAPALARRWDLPVHVHPVELPQAEGKLLPRYANPLDRRILGPLLRLLPAKTRARLVAAGDLTGTAHGLDTITGPPGLPGWEAVPTPGHTPGHVAYLRRHDRVLITGDALLTVDLNAFGRRRLAGPPWYTTWHRSTAEDSIRTLAALQPEVVAPGHGEPLTSGAATRLQAGGGPARHTLTTWRVRFRVLPRLPGTADGIVTAADNRGSAFATTPTPSSEGIGVPSVRPEPSLRLPGSSRSAQTTAQARPRWRVLLPARAGRRVVR